MEYKDQVLRAIKKYTVTMLNKDCGFCGVVDCDNFCMINSVKDKKGFEIKIIIKEQSKGLI